MAIVFAVRSDSLTARFSGGYPEPYVFNSRTGGLPTVTADGTAIGGNRINMDGNTRSALRYQSRDNWTTTGDFSVLLRLKFTATSRTSLWTWGSPSATYPAPLFETYRDTSGIRTYQYDDNGNLGIGGTYVVDTMGTSAWHDVFFTYTNSTGVLEIFQDAVSLGTATSTQTYDAPGELDKAGSVGFGWGNFNDSSFHNLNEMVLWDSVEDPTSITLTSGSGSLNGASRTAFVDVAASTGPSGGGGGGGGGAPIKLGSDGGFF